MLNYQRVYSNELILLYRPGDGFLFFHNFSGLSCPTMDFPCRTGAEEVREEKSASYSVVIVFWAKFVIWETQLNQEPTTTKLAQLTTIGPKQLSKLLEVAPRQISQPLGSWKSVDQPRNWASTCWTILDHGPCFNCRGTPTDQSLRVCRPRCLLQRPGYGDSYSYTHVSQMWWFSINYCDSVETCWM